MSRVTKEINKISLAVISISGKLIIYVLIAVAFVLGARKSYEFGHRIFFAPGMEAAPGTEVTVTIDEDDSVAQVGRILEDAGLIRDQAAFAIQALCYKYEVQEGTFLLNTSYSSKEIINLLSEPAEGEE